MECTVEDFQPNGSGGDLRLRTRTKQRIVVTMWTDKNKQCAKYFPMRYGVCQHVHKAQGGELKHVTVWPGVKCMPAAGCTALSRAATATITSWAASSSLSTSSLRRTRIRHTTGAEACTGDCFDNRISKQAQNKMKMAVAMTTDRLTSRRWPQL